MEFAERLKTLRKQVKLTQGHIAEKLNISQQAYASWERGVKKPTQENHNIELLFRMNSKGLTDEEKKVFQKELIEFMEERKKLFDGDK